MSASAPIPYPTCLESHVIFLRESRQYFAEKEYGRDHPRAGTPSASTQLEEHQMFAGRGAHDAAKRRERGVAMETQMATKEPAKKSAIENKVDVIATWDQAGWRILRIPL